MRLSLTYNLICSSDNILQLFSNECLKTETKVITELIIMVANIVITNQNLSAKRGKVLMLCSDWVKHFAGVCEPLDTRHISSLSKLTSLFMC